MKAFSEFMVLEPRTIEEAIAAKTEVSGSRYIAGGTDLIANLRRGLDDPTLLIDVRHISRLQSMDFTAAGLTIGSAIVLAELARDKRLRRRYPALSAAAAAVAAPAHREAATVGGNLSLDTRCLYYNESAWWREANGFCLKHRGVTCHIAPGGTRCWAAYSGDLAPALLVYRAEVEIADESGTRRVPLSELFEDDGAAHLRLAPGGLVVSVRLPHDPWPAAYAKVRLRSAIDFPLVGVAVAMRVKNKRVRDLRVALTGVASRPVLVHDTNTFVGSVLSTAALDRLCDLVQKQISPMRTTAATPFYRRRVAAVIVRRLVSELAG